MTLQVPYDLRAIMTEHEHHFTDTWAMCLSQGVGITGRCWPYTLAELAFALEAERDDLSYTVNNVCVELDKSIAEVETWRARTEELLRIIQGDNNDDPEPNRCRNTTRSPKGLLRCVQVAGHEKDPRSIHQVMVGYL